MSHPQISSGDVNDFKKRKIEGGAAVDERVAGVNARQEKLLERFEKIRTDFAKCPRGAELSERERAFVSDVISIKQSIEPDEQQDTYRNGHTFEPWERLEQVKSTRGPAVFWTS